MGLLDDAIREHLELKRRHGADPDDVARQENEVLGATRRAEFARPEGGAPAETPESAEPVDREQMLADEASREEVVPEEPAAAEEIVADEPVAEAEAPVEAGDEREPFDIEAVEATPSAAEPPSERDPWLEDEPDEVPVDEALDRPRTGDPETREEDVLEETPDFLQETPEHDRLWFEQRPPRDFDWDK